MQIAVFSSKPYDERYFEAANAPGFDLVFHETRLSAETARLAHGSEVVCSFVNDQLDSATIELLATEGVRLIALRCAGFNNVDLSAAQTHGISVARVPAYSPYAVAEHAVALALTLNRKLHRAYNRVREGNFSLEGMVGFDMHGKTVGIVGTGQIGTVAARILSGFGCRVLAFDPVENPECVALGVRYTDLPTLFSESDIISLQCPLTDRTHHLIDDAAIAMMKPGVMIINTSRGAVVDARALINGLKIGRIGSVGLDVYEEEAELFFQDRSSSFIADDVFARLISFPNVLVTGHQGFFTNEALTAIAQTTIANVSAFAATGQPVHPAEPAG